MRYFTFKPLFIAALFGLAVGTAHAENVYPADLAKQQPEVARAFSQLTGKIAKKHAWVKQFGVTPPVEEITVENETYLRLSGCKPHDCPSEKYVVLVSKHSKKAVGAYVSSTYSSGIGPSSSQIRWLGDPTSEQVAALVPSLF